MPCACRGASSTDAVRGLLALNRVLEGSELYSGRDGNFSWWQGDRNPGLGAFRASDMQGLADFLGQQYGQIESLAALSAPPLSSVGVVSGLPAPPWKSSPRS